MTMTTGAMMRICLAITFSIFFAAPIHADPLKIVFVSGSFLYNSDQVLTEFKSWIETNYPARVTLVSATDWDNLPGLEALETCDVALFYTRRLRIEGEQLQRIREYARAGRPIVAVRTASHGFENWPEFDREILGGDYQRHFPEGPTMTVALKANHPVLVGVSPFSSTSSLYRNPGIAPDCTVLLEGETSDGTQPVAWTRDRNLGRVFYTSLGATADFEQDSFRRLIANALYWAASLDVPSPASGAAAGTSVSDLR
jgi:type 1 glutamine amidotransferase